MDRAVIAMRLGQLREEMLSMSLSDRAAFDLARLLSPDYVDNDSFLGLFLHAEVFDPKAAAARLVRHFQKKIELFGPNRLVHPISLRDLAANDQMALSSGGVLLLPEKDEQGRAVLITRYSRMKYRDYANMVRRARLDDYWGQKIIDRLQGLPILYC